MKLASFAGSGVKIRFHLRSGILTQGPKIVIFSGSCKSILFDYFGQEMKIRKNQFDGGFPKRPNSRSKMKLALIYAVVF